MRILKKSFSFIVPLLLILLVFFSSTRISNADASTYKLEVNAQANVVTVYKKIQGEWEPYRAMLCSTGLGSGENRTPTGTFYVKGRWDWGAMVGNVYARYCVHFYEDYLFHSVPYNVRYNKKSQPTAEFNKLGQDASHGCVRLSTMDAKWVYDHCDRGTKVVIYNSSNPGPLGKPPAIKVSTSRKTYWDPTDPDSSNPYFKLKNPKITISSKKELVVDRGSSYSLKAGVYAKDPNTFQDLTNLLTVHQVEWFSEDKNAYVNHSFSTSKLGTYRVTYKVADPYSGTSTETVKIRVADLLAAPVVTAGISEYSGKVKLTWKAVDGASKYEVYRYNSKTGYYDKMFTTTATSYVNTSAVAGKEYYYKVKAIHPNGYANSPYSKVVSRVCDLPKPVVTGGNNAVTGNVRLTWDPVEGAINYEVYRASAKNGTYTKMFTTKNCSYVNTSCVAGKEYDYKVKAIHENRYAHSAFSTIVTRVCDLPRPVLTVENDAVTGNLRLIWNAIDGAINYEVYRASEKNGTYTKVFTTTDTSYVDPSAIAGKEHYYKVKAIHKNRYAHSAFSVEVLISPDESNSCK